MGVRLSRTKRSGKKIEKPTGKLSFPTRRRKLRIKVSAMGRITLAIEEHHPKAIEDEKQDEEQREDALPKKKSMKKKRREEKANLPDSRKRRR